MTAVTLRKIGNSLGIILPKSDLDALGVGEGDSLYLSKTPDGYMLTPYDEVFAQQVEAAEEFMKDYRDVLRELAK